MPIKMRIPDGRGYFQPIKSGIKNSRWQPPQKCNHENSIKEDLGSISMVTNMARNLKNQYSVL